MKLILLIICGICFSHTSYAESMSMMDMAVMSGSQFGTSSVLHKGMAMYHASKCSPKRAYHCYLAMAAARQSMSDAGKSNESFNIAETINGSAPLFGSDHSTFEDFCNDNKNNASSVCSHNNTPFKDIQTKPILNNSQLDNIKKGTGVKFDPKSGIATDKNGNNVDLASTGLDAGLSKLGASSSQIASAKSDMLASAKSVAAKITEQKKKLVSELSLGGATGGSQINNKELELEIDENGNAVDFNALWNSVEKDKLGKSGPMKKMIGNNEAVGVSADNLFKMIDRRYKSLDRSRIFVK